jgi:ATP-dependent Clp protease protease subunit
MTNDKASAAFNMSKEKDYTSTVEFGRAMIPTNESEEQEAERYSPIALMFKHRIILAFGEVNAQMAYNIIPQIKKLEKQDPKAPIVLLVNSPGGSVIDGMAIVDVLNEVSCPIHTVGVGMQASMGSIFLSSGGDVKLDTGSRSMTRNAQLMIHQIASGGRGQHTDLEISLEHASKLHEDLKSVYVAATGLNHKFWDLVVERDTWFSAEQALKLGVIDSIVEDAKPKNRFAADAKRPYNEQSKARTSAHSEIETMSAEKIVSIVNSGNSNNAEWARYRAELLVKLSEFPEYWTPTLAAEKALAQKATAAANDDKKAVPAHKKGNAPKA